MKIDNFFAELKRRNVYKVAVAYAVAAWLLIQAASIFLPAFEAPPWVLKVFLIVLLLGFAVALALSWAFEITPQGIKRESEVDATQSITTRTGRKIVGVTIMLAAVAFGMLAFQLLRPRPTASTSSEPASSITLTIPAKSIAVLPFENLSSDKENAYFADGIQDEILTKLASVADLKVISRTSTAKYKSKPEDLKTVSQQLGVATVLEGTVQKISDKVRVNVQLIDARTDSHLWAKTYDGNARDIFGVESEVSQQVADALRAKLSPTENKTLAKAPTQDPDAYDLFLKGEYELRQGENLLTAEWFERSATYYRQALDRDPNFALAAARLAESRLLLHYYAHPLSPGELDEVKSIANRAIALDPELAESHEALGLFYYWVHLDYEGALVEFRQALDLQPNNARALAFFGYVYRRQGKWQQSLAELTKAEALDPRDSQIPANRAVSYGALRQWDAAKRAASRTLALEPHSAPATRMLVLSCINGEADIGAAEHLLRNVSSGTRFAGSIRGSFFRCGWTNPATFSANRDSRRVR